MADRGAGAQHAFRSIETARSSGIAIDRDQAFRLRKSRALAAHRVRHAAAHQRRVARREQRDRFLDALLGELGFADEASRPKAGPARAGSTQLPFGAAGGAVFSFAYSSGCSARWIFSAVIGSSVMRTPTASAIALAIAAGTASSPISPRPLAPYGPLGS